MNKEDENKLENVIESCTLYRGVFLRKTELMTRLEDAFPEKKEETFDQSMEKLDQDINKIAEGSP